MNSRVTKTIAYEAASKMKEKAYSKKIEHAYEKLNAAGEELVRKYVPAPVIACVNEYSTYIVYSEGASITAIRENSNGWTSREHNIAVHLSFKIPSNSNYITVDAKEYASIRRLYDKAKSLEEERDRFGDEVFDALVGLRTERNVEKELPRGESCPDEGVRRSARDYRFNQGGAVMTQEQYFRAVAISSRIDELEKVKDEIKETTKHRLWYANKLGSDNWCLASEWRMRYIDKLLDKHDLMIRKEIEDEIEKLKKEIETL